MKIKKTSNSNKYLKLLIEQNKMLMKQNDLLTQRINQLEKPVPKPITSIIKTLTPVPKPRKKTFRRRRRRRIKYSFCNNNIK